MKQWRMTLALLALGFGAGVGVYVGAQDGPGPEGGGGGGTPGGADTEVQFNDMGAFGGDAALSWDGSKLTVGLPDVMTVNGAVISSQFALNSDSASIYESDSHQDAGGLGPIYYGARSRGTAAAHTIVGSGDSMLSLYGIGWDGTDYATSALIQFVVNGTPGANDMPGAIDFYTSPDGSQTLARHLRIEQGGAFNVGVDGVGAAGQVLSSGGAGVPPTWETVSGGVTQTTGNFTASYTVAGTTTPTQVFNYVLTGSVVSLRITQNITAFTSDSALWETAAGDVPVGLRPAANVILMGFSCQDAGVNVSCGLTIESDGTVAYCLLVLTTCAPGNWTATGSKVMTATTNQNVMSYTLN